MARGRLRIYLGAAPGVGKTVAMLDEGRRRLARGTDVVVGLVETHGREHTAEMITGLEVLPRARLDYRGTTFEETEVERIEVEHANRYRLQLENFARAVAGEEPPLLGRDDAVAQARVLDALLRSAGTGAPVSIQ